MYSTVVTTLALGFCDIDLYVMVCTAELIATLQSLMLAHLV